MINFPLTTDTNEPPVDRSHSWMGVFVSVLLHLSILLVLAATYFTWETEPPPELGINAVLSDGTREEDHNEAQIDFDALPEEQLFAEVQATNPAVDLLADRQPTLVGTVGAPDSLGQGLGDGGLEGGVGFFGTEAVGRSIVFVVDCSGSMEGKRFPRAISELSSSLNGLQPAQEFDVLFYNNNALPMTYRGRRLGLVKANRMNLQRARRWIRLRTAHGGTVPNEALRLALKEEPDVLFFLTDAQQIPRLVRFQIRQWNKHGTTVHTICFGNRGGEVLMKGIAQDNHGRYRFVQ